MLLRGSEALAGKGIEGNAVIEGSRMTVPRRADRQGAVVNVWLREQCGRGGRKKSLAVAVKCWQL
jgi:hypothetical protein